MGKPTFDLCCSEEDFRSGEGGGTLLFRWGREAGTLFKAARLWEGGSIFGPTEINRRYLFSEYIGE
jgi:hypothetical protein